jgi:type VI secretion system protein ImpJ
MSRKLLWTEGLFVTQHHFQQLDRYHEGRLSDRVRGLHAFDWGVTELLIDERALSSGQLRVNRLSAVLPGGTMVMGGDGHGDVIAPRPFDAEFTPQMAHLDVYVAVAQEVEGMPTVALEGATVQGTRYRRAQENVPDLNSGTAPVAMDVVRPDVRLLFGDERRDGFDTLRIAQLVRSSSGAVVLRDTCVPPCLRIAASVFLERGFRSLLTQMTSRQRALAETRRQRSAGNVEFDAGDLPKLWLLSTLNSFIPGMAHLVDAGAAHPEAAYLMLGQLIGELCTFAADGDPTQIPKFNYLDLGSVFEPMFARANSLIGSAIKERCIEIPLARRPDGVYVGNAPGPEIMRSEFFVAVSTTLPDAQVRERLPRLMKIASSNQIGAILNSAMTGATVELEYRPPSALPIRPGILWFRLGRSAEFWADIVATGTFALYHPFDPQSLQLSLFAIEAEAKR